MLSIRSFSLLQSILADSVAFSQFWNALLQVSGVMLSIRSFFTIAVYLRWTVWLLASSGMFSSCFLVSCSAKNRFYCCSLSEIHSVAFSQFCNVLLLLSDVMLSIRSVLLLQSILVDSVAFSEFCNVLLLLYCSLSEVDNVAFSQFCNILLLFSDVMLSIGSFFTIAVYLR